MVNKRKEKKKRKIQIWELFESNAPTMQEKQKGKGKEQMKD